MNQLHLYLRSSDESPSQCFEQKQVQNGDSFAKVHLVEVEFPTTKTQSFLVHLQTTLNVTKSILAHFYHIINIGMNEVIQQL